MPASIDAARAELRALIEEGIEFPARPGMRDGSTPRRRSAVLILFGSLDRVSARAATPTVPLELDVLLMRRSDSLRHHAGQVSFPGGGVEPGDTGPAHTALREAAEETGLDPAGVEILGVLPDVPLAVSDNLVTPVIGWWTRPSAIAADDTESVEVFRAPVAELLDPAARGTSVMRRDGTVFRGPAFDLENGRILWGFTAIILSTLFDRLGWAVPWDEGRIFPVTSGIRSN